MITKVDDIKTQMANLNEKQEKFEVFMLEKILSDKLTQQNIDNLTQNNNEMKTNILQHHLILEHHDNKFKKLILPMLEDIIALLTMQHQDKKNKSLDSDLKNRLNRHLAQLKKTSESKTSPN